MRMCLFHARCRFVVVPWWKRYDKEDSGTIGVSVKAERHWDVQQKDLYSLFLPFHSIDAWPRAQESKIQSTVLFWSNTSKRLISRLEGSEMNEWMSEWKCAFVRNEIKFETHRTYLWYCHYAIQQFDRHRYIFEVHHCLVLPSAQLCSAKRKRKRKIRTNDINSEYWHR